ncbi:hypothetical protein PGIGA_G00069430 [Pangasianodon gigas]|uniref:Uncharacterized protein n=1 Tax=Pangasianodon gigas TaxID=30993 RepID=A0ACC5X727_PANGG|nr:hypothetical protein [Pangasianodon gigas]
MATKAGDDPESLMSLCTVFCLKNLRRTMCYTGERNKLCLRPDVFLPSEICDKLVNVYMELVHTDSEFEPQDGFFQLFCDPHSTRLSRLHLREDVVRDRDLEAIGKQDLMELHLTCCNHLSSRSLRTLRNFRHTLVSLSLFGCSNIFFRKSSAEDDDDEDEDEDEEFCDGTDFSFQGFRRLCMLNVGSLPGDVDPEALLKPLDTLRALDLSSTHLPRPAFLAQWREQLASLVLYNVDLNDELIATVLHMSRLRHLDISREGQRSSKFKLTRKILTNIVQSLGNLVSLDISGHVMLDNCTVPYIEEAMGPPSIEPCKSSIYPFQGLKRPLQFLGLYNTTLCNVTHIPAFKVTGSKNEEQVLNAIEAYTEHRPELAHRAINQLFDFVRIQHCNNLVRAVQLVIAALKCHKYDKSIQVTGSAALFYLTSTEYRNYQSVKMRRQVIEVVLNGMEQYQEVTVQRNCCLTLCNFNIPDELEFQYHRVNLLLLKILEPARQDESIQRIAVHLCNALVCQVDNDHKEAVGKMGFVKTMLNLIQKKLHDRQCDQVMEFSWSALWNITDETPDNCQMFLNCSGMNLFLDCLKEFPDKQELHRNMLGLLGNVAEVQRNCCLTLCNFNIPDELEFQYHRVNLLLLKILEPARQDESIQRIAVHLCNALVCQVDNDHKEAVGKMGFVKTMLNLIQKKLHDRQCDQVMEFSWSALWNITDETPDNCQMFLNCSGMNLFLDCLKEFPDKQELHRNMLGLLGNVAEVKELRPQLLTSQFITVFRCSISPHPSSLL